MSMPKEEFVAIQIKRSTRRLIKLSAALRNIDMYSYLDSIVVKDYKRLTKSK